MANYEATRYDFDGSNLIDVEGVNTGIIIPWSSASVPSGFLTCNGAAVSRSTYAALFAVIGTSYGAGNGSTTFNVPNLTDRTCVGKSPTKSQFTTGGANTVTQTGNVPGSAGNTTLATPTIASHTHPLTYKKRGGGTTTLIYEPPNTGCSNTTVNTAATGGGGGHAHPISGNFAGGAKSVLQPYLTVKYIIKT